MDHIHTNEHKLRENLNALKHKGLTVLDSDGQEFSAISRIDQGHVNWQGVSVLWKYADSRIDFIIVRRQSNITAIEVYADLHQWFGS